MYNSVARYIKLLDLWSASQDRLPVKGMSLVSNDSQMRYHWLYAYYIPIACPSSYHEFEGPEAIPYDDEGTFSCSLWCSINGGLNFDVNDI